MIQTEKIKKLKKKNFRSLVPRLIKSKAEADKCQSFKNNNSDDNESDSSKSGISCNLVSNFCNTEDEYQEYDREEEDDDKEDNDLEKKLSRLGLCAACHLTVDTTNRGYDKSLLCNEGHVVCQRCIRHYSLDPGKFTSTSPFFYCSSDWLMTLIVHQLSSITTISYFNI